ncbi:MAG: hypothetical protein QG622_2752 [Actinomycetota bacterium]|nr:hypothetical protein [Actinomycetota bacterium]
MIDVLRDRCRALAVLDLIIDGDDPTHIYTTAWGDDEATLMSNGSGDEWNIVFTADGAFIRVFTHESAMTPYREVWPGLLDGLPAAFRRQVEEPAFCDEEGHFLATAVLWRLAGHDQWHLSENVHLPASRGPHDTDPDGSGMLEILLDDIADRYIKFARDYYEIDADPAAVEHIIQGHSLTDLVIRTLNPDTTIADLRDDIALIRYPVQDA